jgi:hypothetical protein
MTIRVHAHGSLSLHNINILRPSKTVSAYLLWTSKVAKADDGFYHSRLTLYQSRRRTSPINTRERSW